MKKADILSASEKLGIPADRIVYAILDEFLSELSQESITLERVKEILEISRTIGDGNDSKLGAKALSREMEIIRAKLNAAETLAELKVAETVCMTALDNELNKVDLAQELWEVGHRKYYEIGMRLIEKPEATIQSLIEICRELTDSRYSTTAVRAKAWSKVNEMFKVELSCSSITSARAKEIYDFLDSDYETKKVAIRVLLRLLPS